MRNLNQTSIDIMDYIIEFSNFTMTEEIRNKILNYFDNFDKYREMFNNMLFICRNKVSSIEGSLVFNDIFDFLEQEYLLLGFNEYIDFKYLHDIVFLSLRLSTRNSYGAENIWKDIDSEIVNIENLSNQQLKNEIYYLCILIINNFNIVIYNIESTENLLSYCREIDFDNFRIEVLPNAILMT